MNDLKIQELFIKKLQESQFKNEEAKQETLYEILHQISKEEQTAENELAKSQNREPKTILSNDFVKLIDHLEKNNLDFELPEIFDWVVKNKNTSELWQLTAYFRFFSDELQKYAQIVGEHQND
ncbi:hypothetical protein [Mycoplasma tauri]|uniref:Uncharacterized protein n=1 Tax=Mycoplasma tauri TaxID=547987 RepID=A0A953T9V6_9MOLU|nr:hypothetical protein [Mycoplasma tauri]MBZ4195659.1 hypothetical protein [Mycoplasma tauri]MBZ4218187.1 hypothetical protein [Mycoplasma tauri]QSB07725.1 hypothetical protein JS510_01215 [Mycoplasma tauri]